MALNVPGTSLAMSTALKPHGVKAAKLINRINDSFDENNPEQMLKYMDWLRSVILDYIQSVRRTSTTLLLLVAIFELVADSRNAALTIGSFHVTNGSIVLVFLPAVVSFLYLQVVLDVVKTYQLRMAFFYIFEKWCPDAADNGLANFLYGPESICLSTNGVRDDDNIDRVDRLEYRAGLIFASVIIYGILAFEGQAYWVLFSAHNVQVAGLAVSLFATLVCLALGMIFLCFLSRRHRDNEYRPTDGKHRREVLPDA